MSAISKHIHHRDDWKAMLLLVLLTVPVLWLHGCSGDAPQSGANPNPAFEARVNAALDEVERRGLGDWAEYGRAVLAERRIGNSQQFDSLGMVFSIDNVGYIALRDEWEELDVAAAGEVLLEELFHLRTKILSHPPELDELLRKYWEE